MEETKSSVNVKEKARELQGAANRTGNKAIENIMRECAQIMLQMENGNAELLSEIDRLNQKLADKDEQLAGWKALLDAKTAIDGATNTAAPRGRASRTPPFDYVGTLSAMMASGEKTKLVPIYVSNGGKKLPAAYTFRDKARQLGVPITANLAGGYVLLARTDKK